MELQRAFRDLIKRWIVPPRRMTREGTVGVCSPVVLELSPCGGHLRDGAGPGSGGGRRVARPRRPWPAHRRRLGHADHSLGQHNAPSIMIGEFASRPIVAG